MAKKRGRPRKNKRPTDKEILQKMVKERNIAQSTAQGYDSTLKRYLQSTGYDCFYDLLVEARKEEDQRIPLKKTKLKKHLDNYLLYLKDNIRSNNTIHTYFSKLETIYRHFDITLPSRPPMKLAQDYHVSYFDLPDKKMIEKAISESVPPIREYIYFASSSGTAKTECLSITVGMFLDGLREYTTQTEPHMIVKELCDRKDLVPTITLTRKKTDNPYYTCCSSEATYYLLQYLQLREIGTKGHITRDEKLFPINGAALMKEFQHLNDKMGWGYVGPYRRFRTHTLRKFHASNLGCSAEIVDMLEGRRPNKVHATYIKQNPRRTKTIYMEHMHNVMIHPEKFIGPNCGAETLNSKIQEQIDLNLSKRETTHAPANPPTTNDAPMGFSDVQSLVVQIQELTKQVGILEYRIQQLENWRIKNGN